MFRSTATLLSCLCLCAVPALAAADLLQLVPSRDNTLYENAAGSFSNGSGTWLFAGRTGSMGSEELRRAVLAFDTSALPPGSTVQSVALQLTIDRAPDSGATSDFAALHRLLADWGEGASNAPGAEGAGTVAEAGDATWIHGFFPDDTWATPGGDFVPQASQTAPFGTTAPEIITFASNTAMVADVQSWVDDPASNFGWLIKGDEDTAQNSRRLFSRNSIINGNVPVTAADLPTLSIDFSPPSITDALVLTPVASGLVEPVGLANAADGSGRLFIVERSGLIRIFDSATQTLLATPYLNLSTLVDTTGSEQGLLGLAFHPDFATNQKFYVYYIRDPGAGQDRSVVAEYRQSLGDPNVADPLSAALVLEFVQPFSNHNGGDLHFDAHGYLTISSGDGGSGGDPNNNAQNVNSLLGKLLRIDVDAAPPPTGQLCGLNPAYGIPPGNAFPGTSDGCDEILHYGLRNPWRFSFDAGTEALFIGDVGQGDWEEVDSVAAGAAGVNFGWSCFEGNQVFNAGRSCPGAVFPIIEYPSSGMGISECSVTGGYLYRGSATALYGRYVYGDYCSSRIWIAVHNGTQWLAEEWPGADAVLASIAAFGQDERCELYVADAVAGKIFRIDDTGLIKRSGFESMRC